MMATRTLLFVVLIAMISGCNQDDDKTYSNNKGRFVRFNLQLDNNDQPIEFPAIAPAAKAVNLYEKDNLKTLKIPVAITSEPLQQTVEVEFSTLLNGISDVTITPSTTLTFEGNKLVDTIFIKVNERINPSLNPSITLELLSSSNENIAIGMPNVEFPLDQLIINLNEIDLTYNIEGSSNIDIQGLQGETKEITIKFPNGFTENAIQNIQLFDELQSNYPYSITQQPVTSEDEIRFNFIVDAALTDPTIPYSTRLQVNDIPDYINTGVEDITFKRNPLVDRDLSANTASNFYNTADQFYRLYGVNWMDFNTDGVCEWRDFNTFTIPVIVDYVSVGNDPYPNGILIDDRGTADITDDLYYHAFQVGFRAAQNTTNPFNLRRWFNNESTSETNSPGFNIVPALEFFPENGNSLTNGTVQVVDETIIIGTTPANGSVRERISISGSGTYFETSPGVFEIEFELNATNNRLFGGTRVAKYHLYNVNNFTDPPLLNTGCFQPINL